MADRGIAKYNANTLNSSNFATNAEKYNNNIIRIPEKEYDLNKDIL